MQKPRTPGERIRALRKKHGWTQFELANFVSVTNVTISAWERDLHEPKGRHLDRLCAVLKTTGQYILHGIEGYAIAEPMTEYDAGGVHSARRVPLIGWKSALENVQNQGSGIAEEQVEDWISTAMRCSHKSFALKVFGSSMAASDGLSVPPDYIIIIDPDEANNIRHGDLIIAIDQSGKSLTFKQFQTNGIERWLKALNPGYPELHGPFEVVGKVVYAGMDL